MPQLEHLSISDGTEAVIAAVHRDGACIVDDLITEECCDSLMQDFMPHVMGVDWCNMQAPDSDYVGLDNAEFFGVKTKRFHGLPGLSLHSEEIIAHPFLVRLARQILGAGDRCRDIRVSNMELMVLGEGEVQQAYHRDFDSWPYIQPEGVNLISANIAMCDFTETNGATVVVPGSHQWEPGRQPTEKETCLAVMKKGAALIYSGHVLHGGGENREHSIRTGFYIGYIPSWLSNLENHAVSNSQETIAALGEETRTLLDIVPGGWIVIP